MSDVEQHDGGYWVAGTRVSLDSVVYAFLAGQSPESIIQSFSVLTLEEVYGAVAFYLGHRAEVEACLARGRQQYEDLAARAREGDPIFYQKLADARRARAAGGSRS